MNRTAIMRLLCLLLALVLCVGIMPPMTPVQADESTSDTPSVDAQERSDEDASESSVALPESIDEFYMDVAIVCTATSGSSVHDRAVHIFATECNFPIVGIKFAFEYDRTLASFYASGSGASLFFPEGSKETVRNEGISSATLTGSSDVPISSSEKGLVGLYFGQSSFAYELYPFDVNITEFIVYVPLADGTVAEYIPDYCPQFHVPLMKYDENEAHLGPRQTALAEDWIAWGSMAQEGPLLWRLHKDGTLTFSGIGNIPSYTPDALAPWMEYRDQIKKVVMQNGVHSIGTYAFYGCPNLEEVVFPLSHIAMDERIFYIKDSAFDGCTSLKKLSPFPALKETGELYIWSRAFARTALTTLHIPDRTMFHADIVADCYSLTHFTAHPDLDGYYVDQWGALVRKSSDCIYIFPMGMQGEYRLPIGRDHLTDEHFANCQGLTKIVLSDCYSVGSGAFRNCSVKEIYFPTDAPGIAQDAFENVTAIVYYNADDPSWTEDKMQHYGGNLTWVPHTHEYTVQEIAPTCKERGFISYTCSTCGYYYEEDGDLPLGHDMGAYIETKPPTCTQGGEKRCYCSRCDYFEAHPLYVLEHSWQDTDQEGIHTCTSCGLTEGKYRLFLPSETPDGFDSIWVDGVEYSFPPEGRRYITLTHPNGKVLTILKHRNDDSEDIHTQYPSVMYTWLLTCNEEAGRYGVNDAFPKHYNLLYYSGTSIRIKGVKGIRMITGMHKATRKLLIEKGVMHGSTYYKLEETGTLLAWAKDLEGGNPLTLGQPYVKSNYAYKRDKADPIYEQVDLYLYYTNVLVGFTNDQCKDDIAMRPYMILQDENGDQITIYGGIVYRSIGYIAYQNRNVFKPSDPAYDYVWDIIHHVYGDQYDAEFKG